jgi:hypothetical protein
MKSYPTSTSVSPGLTLTDAATLDAALEHVLTTIPLETQGIYSPQTIYSVLLWAASRHDTIEHTCQVLEGVPSSNDIRFHHDHSPSGGLLAIRRVGLYSGQSLGLALVDSSEPDASRRTTGVSGALPPQDDAGVSPPCDRATVSAYSRRGYFCLRVTFVIY